MTDIYKLENYGQGPVHIGMLVVPENGGLIYAALTDAEYAVFILAPGVRAALDSTQAWAYTSSRTVYERPAVDISANGADFNGENMYNVKARQLIKTTDYILTEADSGSTIFLNKATAIKATIPAAMPIGFKCKVVQMGAGASTIEAATNATANKLATKTLVIAAQYGAVEIEVYANSDGAHAVAVVSGDLTTA